jgi:putative FmdB family regulatory protein
MPTYEYECENCGHHFEEFQSIKAKPLKKCPACGKSKLNRLIGTGSAVIFKGSGFYQTDYRSDSYKSSAKSESGSLSSSASDGKETKTESKDTKTESKEAKSETKETTGAAPANKTAKKKPA